MSALRVRLLTWLADYPLARRVLESLLAARSRRHLARLDQLPAVRGQYRALQGLIHRARSTPFGRDHDFARIRSVQDFRRLVPLRTPTELLRLYHREGYTWPGSNLPIAQLHPELRRSTAPVRLSLELLQAQRRAIRTALSLVLRQRPHTRLLEGASLWLGDDTLVANARRGLLDRLARDRFPLTLCHAVLDASGQDCGWSHRLDGSVSALAARFAHESITTLVGPAERIALLLDEVRRQRGESDLRHIWPHLGAVVCTRRDRTRPLDSLRDSVGERVPVVELVTRPEAPLAVEDWRHGGLRLLTDHGAFFEFLPIESSTPHRLGVDEVRLDEPYEVAISSPAGVWAQRTGMVVAFQSLEPPLIRLLPPLRNDERVALPLVPRAVHRPVADTPAERSETSFRIPSSVHADRG